MSVINQAPDENRKGPVRWDLAATSIDQDPGFAMLMPQYQIRLFACLDFPRRWWKFDSKPLSFIDVGAIGNPSARAAGEEGRDRQKAQQK